MIYYIGDLHFGHRKVIEYDKRPFATVEEMDKVLINNWNKKVNEDDSVYIIGDFIYKSSHDATYYLKQLKGHKHLIVGNHDWRTLEDAKACQYFESIEDMGYVKDDDTEVVMCHYPMVEWKGSRWKRNASVLVFSHIHNNTDSTYDIMTSIHNALNAGCMVNGYEPCTLVELQENAKEWRCLKRKMEELR